MLPQAPVTEFAVVPAKAVGDRLAEEDLVLGLALEGAARAYPLAMLNAEPRTKVLNDRLAGRAIVVTWCDKCQAGVVYDRTVAGQTLTFGIFGSLWRDSLVMDDAETKTQWSQWEGVARRGKLQGAGLRRLPSVIVSWRDWRTLHPETDAAVLEKKQTDFEVDRFRDAAQYVLAIGEGAEAKAWSLAQIRDQGVINDVWRDRPVAAIYLQSSGTARLVERLAQGKTITLHVKEDELRDDETGSRWNGVTAKASAGPLEGTSLTPLPSWLTTRAVWERFHPR